MECEYEYFKGTERMLCGEKAIGKVGTKYVCMEHAVFAGSLGKTVRPIHSWQELEESLNGE